MAYVEAIANGGSGVTAARANACRSGYFARNRVVVTVAGVQRKAIKEDLAIRIPTGREPATADLTFKGGGSFVPERGQSVVIGHGTADNALFRGRIIRADRGVVRHVEPKPTYTIEATDLLFDLARAYLPDGLVTRSLSAASIVRGILSAATPSTTSLGFSAAYVQGDMAWVSEFIVGPTESVVSAFDRLAAAIGGTWYSDVRQRVHFWTTADPETKPTINTLTGTGTNYFHLRRVTDLPRVFSRVVGLGVGTTTAHDVSSDETYVPLESADALIDATSVIGLDTYYVLSTGRVIVQAAPRSVVGFLPPTVLDARPALLTAAPTSATTDGYWVADIVEDANVVSGSEGFRGHQWVGVDGNYFRVSSVSGYSSTANTIYSRLFTPQSGPGAPPPTGLGAVPAGTGFMAEKYEIRLAAGESGPTRVIPKGAPVRAYYDVSSAATANQVASLTGSLASGWATDVVDDSGLRPGELITACEQRLSESHPDRWLTLTLDTRDALFDRGQTVHFAVTAPGETGGPGITGSYPIQQVTIDGFAEMADSKGPMRHVTLGPLTRPSLFLEWDRWDV